MKDSEFCPKCGAKLEPGEPFCGNCGFDTESTDNAMLVPQDPIQPAPMVSAQIPGPPKTSSSGSQKTAIIILSVLLGVVVLISGVTFLWFSLGSRLISNSTNTAANHSTQGSTGEKQGTIELPSYSLNEGSYTSSQKVEINKPAGEEIVVYFTIDGSDPTDKSSRYDSAIVLSTTTTLKSIAIDKNGNTSGIKTGSYTITIPQQATTQQPAATTTPAATVEPEVSEWQQFENNISGTWQWTDGSGFTLYYQFSNGMLLVTDGGSDYYYDYYSSTVTTGTNGTVYTGGDQLYIDCNPLGDNAIYINGYLCTYAP